MCRIFILIAIFFNTVQIRAQNLNDTFFLLGSLEDYMGRSFTKNNPKDWSYVMSLHESRLSVIRRIEEISLCKFKMRKKKKNCGNCHEFYVLKNFFKAKRINKFYEFRNGTWTDNLGFRFYVGSIICDKINNASKNVQLSFLAGLFLTQGIKESGVYKIVLANTPHKFECAKQILMNLGCVIANEKITTGTIPIAYLIEFVPSDELKGVIETEISTRGF